MRFLPAILLSLGIHFMLMALLSLVPQPLPESHTVVVDFVSSKDQNPARQIVRSAIIPDKYKVESTEDKLKFLSEHTQRVKQQTRAFLNDLTKNRGNTNQNKDEHQMYKPNSIDELAPKYNIRPKEIRVSNESGQSTISDSISQEVEVGRVTALNTDQYLFYSFYERVSDLVYIRWKHLVLAAQDNLMPTRVSYNSSNNWTTQVEIRIKPSGEFISGHVMKPSGIPEFDRAAVAAFHQAGMFPNPPKELVDPEDKFIRLKYSLLVHFDPKVLVQK